MHFDPVLPHDKPSLLRPAVLQALRDLCPASGQRGEYIRPLADSQYGAVDRQRRDVRPLHAEARSMRQGVASSPTLANGLDPELATPCRIASE